MAVLNSQSAAVASAAAGKAVDAILYHTERSDHFYISAAQGAVAGDIASTLEIAVLPPGKWRFVGPQSFITTSAFGAARTLSIGHGGFTKPDGTVVAAGPAAFDTARDVSVALIGTTAFAPGNALLTGDGTFLIDSRTPVTILATVAGGTIPAAATIGGILKFLRG